MGKSPFVDEEDDDSIYFHSLKHTESSFSFYVAIGYLGISVSNSDITFEQTSAKIKLSGDFENRIRDIRDNLVILGEAHFESRFGESAYITTTSTPYRVASM